MLTIKCTGTYLATEGLPEALYALNAEDIGAVENFNALVAEHLTILVNVRLMAKATGGQGVAGN